jgi:steroid delta-isomerase-like uncharacterized protein
MASNIETHRAAHQAWNRRDYDGVISKMAPDISYEDHPGGRTMKSRDEFRGWAEDWATAMSDGEIFDATYIDGGDTSVSVFQARGTNDGPFGPLPATGRRLTFTLCEILRYDTDGGMISGEIFYDMLGILVQLGHLEPPTT